MIDDALMRPGRLEVQMEIGQLQTPTKCSSLFSYYISIHVLDSLKLGSTGSCNWKIIYEHVCNFCFVKLTGYKVNGLLLVVCRNV